MSSFFKVVDADISNMDDSIAMNNNDISSNEARDVSVNNLEE